MLFEDAVSQDTRRVCLLLCLLAAQVIALMLDDSPTARLPEPHQDPSFRAKPLWPQSICTHPMTSDPPAALKCSEESKWRAGQHSQHTSQLGAGALRKATTCEQIWSHSGG